MERNDGIYLHVSEEERLLHRVNRQLRRQEKHQRNYILGGKDQFVLIKYDGFDIASSTDSLIKLSGNCYINFVYNHDLGKYLPQTSEKELWIKADRSVDTPLVITSGIDAIAEEMKSIAEPEFTHNVVVPFLKKKSTTFVLENETLREKPCSISLHRGVHNMIVRSGRKIGSKNFMYIGGKNSVRILCVYFNSHGDVAKTSYGGIASVTDSLSFSLCGLGGAAHVCFNGKEFIFPQATRGATPWTDIISTDPEELFITGTVGSACLHIRETQFASFEQLVQAYARMCLEERLKSKLPSVKHPYRY